MPLPDQEEFGQVTYLEAMHYNYEARKGRIGAVRRKGKGYLKGRM